MQSSKTMSPELIVAILLGFVGSISGVGGFLLAWRGERGRRKLETSQGENIESDTAGKWKSFADECTETIEQMRTELKRRDVEQLERDRVNAAEITALRTEVETMRTEKLISDKRMVQRDSLILDYTFWVQQAYAQFVELNIPPRFHVKPVEFYLDPGDPLLLKKGKVTQ
jgi:hypothetical protein